MMAEPGPIPGSMLQARFERELVAGEHCVIDTGHPVGFKIVVA